eukprot:2902280-Ditylum_brightwellii.AAC.1
MAWQTLCEWYDVDVMKSETADMIREKLTGYCLHNRDSTSQYINNRLTSYWELNEIPGEVLSDSVKQNFPTLFWVQPDPLLIADKAMKLKIAW